MACILVALLAAVFSSCRAEVSWTQKEETKADGTSTKETTTEFEGEIFPNGGSITTDGKSVDMKVEGPNGTTTETPEPGEEVPIPEGSTSVETEETVTPQWCLDCMPGIFQPQRLAGRAGAFQHLHRAYHRFERYVPEGQWEAFLYTEDATPGISGEDAAKYLWSEFVMNLSSGFSHAPTTPTELRDVRFYGMRVSEAGGQLYLSFADIKPFASLSFTLTEVGTANSETFDLSTPGAVQSFQNGWYTASIPVDFMPANIVDPEIELVPVIQNAGSSTTKGYVRTLGW